LETQPPSALKWFPSNEEPTMPIESKLRNLLSTRAAEGLPVVAALLCALVAMPADAASPDLVQPDILLPSSTWGSGPMVASLAQLVRHEGPIRGDEPKSTNNPQTSPGVLLARARIGSAGHFDRPATGPIHVERLALPLQAADLVARTRVVPKFEPLDYTSQPLR
jgi:hypothetical protein